jgi:hypothetical protein
MEVVTYRPEHSGELMSFLREQFPHSPQKGDPSFFEWRFARSPLGSSLGCYHLAIENRRIVGQLGAIRDRLWAMDRWWDCCWLVDLVVAKEHRGGSSTAVFRMFEHLLKKKCPLLLGTGAGPKLLRFYKALGFRYREIAGTYYSIRRPDRLRAFGDESGVDGPVLKPMLPFGGTGLRALRAARDMLRRAPSEEMEFEHLNFFGTETDELIARLKPSFPVTPFRSAASLNWKFNQRPLGKHFVITARRKGHAGIDGYMAVKEMERPDRAHWAEVVDFLTARYDHAAMEGLIDRAEKEAAAAGVDFVRLRCSLPEHHGLLKAPFWVRRDREVFDGTFFRAENADLTRHLEEAPWHLTSLVSDRTDHGSDEIATARKETNEWTKSNV